MIGMQRCGETDPTGETIKPANVREKKKKQEETNSYNRKIDGTLADI